MNCLSPSLRDLPATLPAPDASTASHAAKPGSAQDLAELDVAGTTSYTAPTCLQIFPVMPSRAGSAGPPLTGWSLMLLWTFEYDQQLPLCLKRSRVFVSPLSLTRKGILPLPHPLLRGKRVPCLQEPISKVKVCGGDQKPSSAFPYPCFQL